jgi:hypothetical protein
MNEKTPIKREDIQVGDLIRIEYSDEESATEYRVTLGLIGMRISGKPFLLDRPVVLPTVPGWYTNGGQIVTFSNRGMWYIGSHFMDAEVIARSYLPLTRLMTEAEWEAGR